MAFVLLALLGIRIQDDLFGLPKYYAPKLEEAWEVPVVKQLLAPVSPAQPPPLLTVCSRLPGCHEGPADLFVLVHQPELRDNLSKKRLQ